MKNEYRQQVERELKDENALTEEDEAFLRHCLLDDDGPPQGLHQGKKKRKEEDDV